MADGHLSRPATCYLLCTVRRVRANECVPPTTMSMSRLITLHNTQQKVRPSLVWLKGESLLDKLPTIGLVAIDRRKRKQRRREERAFEWLQSVQGNKNVLAKAASSKFLTGNRRAVVAKGERNELTALRRCGAAANSAYNGGCSRTPSGTSS
jgi:hypothetical protein